MTCSHCEGKGVSRRWRNSWTLYVCTSCGGLGETGTLVGRLDGLHEYPDVTAPTGGKRLALVYLKDGTRDDLPGQTYWRLLLVLATPNFKRGRAHGGTRRDVKNAKGTAVNLAVLTSSVVITGELAEPDQLPPDLPGTFEACVQEAVGFPRSSYRGQWSITQNKRGKRLAVRSRGFIMDRVH